MNGRIKVYLAGPLFTQAERRWNRELARCLNNLIPQCDVILPQDRAAKFIDGTKVNFKGIVRDCISTLGRADLVIALLDGSDPDSGTSWECGYAYALGKPILGIRTDLRASEDDGVNAMLRQTCAAYLSFRATDENLDALARRAVPIVTKLAHRSRPARGARRK
jgi:nucleoside 2-deoxyribosyltransferase